MIRRKPLHDDEKAAFAALARQLISDACILVGCGLLVYGAYLVDPLAAVFTGGAILTAIGVVIGLGDSR